MTVKKNIEYVLDLENETQDIMTKKNEALIKMVSLDVSYLSPISKSLKWRTTSKE